MIFPVLLLAFSMPLAPQSPTPPIAHASHHVVRTAEAKKTPAGPKTAAELQQDIETALRTAPFGGDQLHLAISGKDITLSGEVHSAEHKGVATREARKWAEKDGWSGMHVFNQIAVELPEGGYKQQ